jgi:histidinol phosphatase-like PHP family hydrolase
MIAAIASGAVHMISHPGNPKFPIERKGGMGVRTQRHPTTRITHGGGDCPAIIFTTDITSVRVDY